MKAFPARATAQLYQELAFSEGHDYRKGSPHLTHPQLHDRLLGQLRGALRAVERRGLPLSVLEIGAGDGAFVEPLLAYGCEVAATEISRPSIARLEDHYGRSNAFTAFFDHDGSLEALGARRFSLILFASVLHHIPDYMSAIDRAVSAHLTPRGALVTMQDPLWYPSLRRGSRAFAQATYLTWRLTQGNIRRGLRSRVRWLRDAYREDEASDMVEYHVVRDGVNHDAIRSLLQGNFDRAELLRYWSTQARVWQYVGERLSVRNTFAVVADGYDGRPLAWTPCGSPASRLTS